MKKTYQTDAFISIIIGLLLICIPTNLILSILQFILGFLLVLIYLPTMLLNINSSMNYLKIKSLIFTILGFVIIFFGFNIIGSIIGIIMLGFLLVDLCNSKHKKETFKKDLVKYIIAFVLIFVGINQVIDIIVFVAGILLIIVGIIKLIFDNKPKNKNMTNHQINEKIIDVDFENHEE